MRFEIPDHKILVHEVPMPILWGDMDALGHVNNTVYFKYMEQVRVSWIAAISGQVNDDDEGPVIANTFCNFYRPLVFPGDLIVKLYVAHPGRTSIDTFVSIEKRDEPGVSYAAGGATLVWVSMKDGRPLPLPSFLRALEGKLPALPGADTPPALPEK
ncbi:MAG TPA: thioesterase family protein [Aquabacterium sp.]|uniref:acyl-CoA thioesterase n=1 Tax=Aquabacterium sp. TaxID=1872578 RepID=UPI002DAAB81A|nr:thioesterase family protein [Aquabacterium sp.]HET6787040.1 thioesterase family protein [Aquabacterium sp.]HEX5374360.1 thioesterase family protein [Aquabacterium sp.]